MFTYKDVYMEKLEENRHKVQKSAKMWHKEKSGVAVGKYPKGILENRSQPDFDESLI